jgi:hypothetical protein
MPFYGTVAFKETTIKMFLRKSFLAQSSYGQAAIAIAHELSHVVLDSIQHPLRRDEKAVDLTAMLLGFSHLYHSASLTVRESTLKNTVTFTRLGYLSDRELRTACRLLIPLRWRVLQGLRPFYRLIFVIVTFLIIVAALRAHEIWHAK